AADELGDQAELDQVLRLHAVEHVLAMWAGVAAGPYLGGKADAALLRAVENDLLQAREGTAADEQDVRGVDLQKFLLRVLAPALRGDRGDRALDELQQRLLHTLARHIPRDGRVVGFARNLVDLVD